MPSGFGSMVAGAWARSFLRQFQSELNGMGPATKNRVRRTRDNALALFGQCQASYSNKRDKSIVACCCLVLAAYHELRSQLTEDESFEHVRAAVSRVFKKPTRAMARIWLRLFRNPLRRLRGDRWKRQSRRMYGPGMEFDQEESEGAVDLIVRRCAFHEFFADHSEPRLTQAFCAWDRNWMDVVDSASRSVHTERPTTISTGGDCCRFRLVSTDGQAAADNHDIILVQLKSKEYGEDR